MHELVDAVAVDVGDRPRDVAPRQVGAQPGAGRREGAVPAVEGDGHLQAVAVRARHHEVVGAVAVEVGQHQVVGVLEVVVARHRRRDARGHACAVAGDRGHGVGRRVGLHPHQVGDAVAVGVAAQRVGAVDPTLARGLEGRAGRPRDVGRAQVVERQVAEAVAVEVAQDRCGGARPVGRPVRLPVRLPVGRPVGGIRRLPRRRVVAAGEHDRGHPSGDQCEGHGRSGHHDAGADGGARWARSGRWRRSRARVWTAPAAGDAGRRAAPRRSRSDRPAAWRDCAAGSG